MTRTSEQYEDTTPSRPEEVRITVIYDNHRDSSNLISDWGFACVVQGLDRSILFDTGGDGQVLLANMQASGIVPNQMDAVVISHAHGDHTGGLGTFLSLRRDADVYVPSGFSERSKARIKAQGGNVVEADGPVEVCTKAKTTGTLRKGSIFEQGLCVSTDSGWVLITGCAHPDVIDLAIQARTVTGDSPSLVLGGFHLLGRSPKAINRIVDRFEDLGIERLAPCHCTGDPAKEMFKKHFGDRCTLAGVGTVLRFTPDSHLADSVPQP